MILFSGYLIQKDRLPKAWRWLFWGSPFSYGFNAVAISEFAGTSITCKAGELEPPTSIANFLSPYPLGYEGQQVCAVTDGSDYLRYAGLYADRHLQWAFFAGSVGWTVFYVILFYVSIRFIDFSDFRIATGKNDVRHKLVVAEEKAKAKSPSMHGSILSWGTRTNLVNLI